MEYPFKGWYVLETVNGQKNTPRDVKFTTEKGIVYDDGTEKRVYPQSGTTLKLYADWD